MRASFSYNINWVHTDTLFHKSKYWSVSHVTMTQESIVEKRFGLRNHVCISGISLLHD